MTGSALDQAMLQRNVGRYTIPAAGQPGVAAAPAPQDVLADLERENLMRRTQHAREMAMQREAQLEADRQHAESEEARGRALEAQLVRQRNLEALAAPKQSAEADMLRMLTEKNNALEAKLLETIQQQQAQTTAALQAELSAIRQQMSAPAAPPKSPLEVAQELVQGYQAMQAMLPQPAPAIPGASTPDHLLRIAEINADIEDRRSRNALAMRQQEMEAELRERQVDVDGQRAAHLGNIVTQLGSALPMLFQRDGSAAPAAPPTPEVAPEPAGPMLGFACPHCRLELQVTAPPEGHRPIITCPQCRQRFAFPQDAEVMPAMPDEPEYLEPPLGGPYGTANGNGHMHTIDHAPG